MNKSTEQFLLSEFNNTYTEWRRIREEGRNRMQFMFSIMTAVIGGMVVLIEFKDIGGMETAALIFFIVFALMAVFSWQTVNFMVARAITTDRNTRVLARIRRYFVDKDKSIVKYITWQTDDEPTRFLTNKPTGLLVMSQVLFSVNISFLVIIVTYKLLSVKLIHNCLFFIISWLVTFIITRIISKKRIDNARKLAKGDVRLVEVEGPSNAYV